MLRFFPVRFLLFVSVFSCMFKVFVFVIFGTLLWPWLYRLFLLSFRVCSFFFFSLGHSKYYSLMLYLFTACLWRFSPVSSPFFKMLILLYFGADFGRVCSACFCSVFVLFLFVFFLLGMVNINPRRSAFFPHVFEGFRRFPRPYFKLLFLLYFGVWFAPCLSTCLGLIYPLLCELFSCLPWAYPYTPPRTPQSH